MYSRRWVWDWQTQHSGKILVETRKILVETKKILVDFHPIAMLFGVGYHVYLHPSMLCTVSNSQYKYSPVPRCQANAAFFLLVFLCISCMSTFLLSHIFELSPSHGIFKEWQLSFHDTGNQLSSNFSLKTSSLHFLLVCGILIILVQNHISAAQC